jgi:hypothetical protein
VSAGRRETFPAPPLNIVSENLMLTELKRVDPDSRHIGISAVAALSTVTRNSPILCSCVVLSKKISVFYKGVLKCGTYADGENFILAWMNTWHVGSR